MTRTRETEIFEIFVTRKCYAGVAESPDLPMTTRFAKIVIRVPVPGRMAAGTARTEHEKVRVGRPRGMDNAAALVAFRRTEIA